MANIDSPDKAAKFALDSVPQLIKIYSIHDLEKLKQELHDVCSSVLAPGVSITKTRLLTSKRAVVQGSSEKGTHLWTFEFNEEGLLTSISTDEAPGISRKMLEKVKELHEEDKVWVRNQLKKGEVK